MAGNDLIGNMIKKQPAKQGRRAAKAAQESSSRPTTIGSFGDDAEDMTTIETHDIKPSKNADGIQQKPSSRRGGWGTDDSRRQKHRKDGDDDDRLRPSSAQGDADSDSDIPVIPELEDTVRDNGTDLASMAPLVAVNRVATYRELDTDLLMHASFLTLDNEIDLKLLAKGLSAEMDVREEDVAWDWDRLFTEVSSELITEWESQERTEEEKITGA